MIPLRTNVTRRLDVQFTSQGLNCSAWLYLPDGHSPAPVIVMAHGLAGTRVMRLDAYAERFCAAGYACLVFDYRFFGDSEGKPRFLVDVAKQLEDWGAALSFVRGRREIDGQRVVLWGTSFAGGHVLRLAAEDRSVEAVISQCPFTDGVASTFGLHPASALRIFVSALRDRIGEALGAAPYRFKDVGTLAPDVGPGYRALLPQGTPTTPPQVLARVGLQLIRYVPGRQAAKISCPILFCVCDRDSLAPAKATLRHARRAPKGEIKRYAEGHFDIYVGESFERVIGDQLDFLRRNVALRSGGM